MYPLSAIGAHVSDCPNHTVGTKYPFKTRGEVALAGTFGYELDITKIAKEEQEQIPQQTAMYHKYNDLVREGDYYRIASYRENHFYDCYMVVSKDKKEALDYLCDRTRTTKLPQPKGTSAGTESESGLSSRETEKCIRW